ncbi:MAG: hypothetical protein INR71_06860, partial [Terriglobus roseus]|nr:hypothetical protein [Terriglobus roseus]
MPKANKSLESALDEERREVMALLEGRRSAPRTGSREPNARLRTASPAGVAQSPVRSMLDIGNAPPHARHASVAGTTPSGVTVPQSAQYPSPSVRSMLDTSSPPPTPHSAPIHHVRSASTASTSSPVSVASPVSAPASGLPSPKTALEDAYQFDMPPAPPGKGGKKKGALASVFGSSSHDHQRPRHNSTSGLVGSRRPMSPSSRLGSSGRSMSPAQRGLNTNSLNLMPDPRKYVSDSGKVIDMSNAYRRLSDANLMRSGGNLANLPSRKGSDPEKGESRAPDGGVRLEKDYFADDDNDDDDDDDEEALDDSDDDADDDEDEDGWGSKKRRGRQRRRSKLGDAESSESPAAASDRRPSSLMEAAEDERKTVGQKYRSLLEP